MKKRIIGLSIAGALLASVAMPGVASAHSAAPCDDSDGDGSPSGHEYAAHHISFLAKEGGMGEGGHKPGSHQGFSLCEPSGLAPGQQ